MAATARWYGKSFQDILNGTSSLNWGSDTIRAALLTSSYTPAVDSDEFWSGISANEIAGTGYTAGGVALAGKSVSYNAAAHETRLLAAASSWSGATFTYRYAVVYKDTGTASTSLLLGWFDPGGAEQVTAGTATITWDQTNGVLKVAV